MVEEDEEQLVVVERDVEEFVESKPVVGPVFERIVVAEDP